MIFFFISFILLFSSRISFRFQFRYSICWYFHFVHNIIFLTSSTSSFSSLSIYKEVILKSLVYLSSGLFQGQFLLIFNFFFSFEWVILSCLFVCLIFFVVKNWTFESNKVVALEIRFFLFPMVFWFFIIGFLGVLQAVSVLRIISLRYKLEVFSNLF